MEKGKPSPSWSSQTHRFAGRPRILLTLLSLLYLAFASSAFANVGVYLFAISGFDNPTCRQALRIKTDRIGILWGTFGDNKKCLNRFLPRLKRLHIHASNETCRRAPRYCEAGREPNHWLRANEYNQELEAGRVGNLEARAKSLARFLARLKTKYPDIKVTVSTGLEDNFTDKAFRQVLRVYRNILPEGTKLVRNPNSDTHGAFSRVYAYELHALQSRFVEGKRCLWSNDGNDIGLSGSSRFRLPNFLTEGEITAKARSYRDRGCEVFLWWNNQGIEGRFIPPSGRRIFLDRFDIRGVNRVIRNVYERR